METLRVSYEDKIKSFQRVISACSISVSKNPLVHLRDHVSTKPLRNLYEHQVLPVWNQWEHAIGPIVIQELEGPVSIKMEKDNTFSQSHIDDMLKTISTTKATNPFLVLESHIDAIAIHFPTDLKTVDVDGTFPTKTFIRLLWQELLAAWHDIFLQHLIRDVTRRFHGKLSLGKGFHNFTNLEIPEEVHNILKQGEKFVPHWKEEPSQAKTHFLKFAMDTTIWAAKLLGDYRIRHLDYSNTGHSEGSPATLYDALSILTASNDHPLASFWQGFGKAVHKYMEMAETNPDTSNLDSICQKELRSKIIQPGFLCALADKMYGLVLLPLEAVLKAESKILDTLGAVVIDDKSPKMILDSLNCEDFLLRTGFSPQMTELLNRFPPIPRVKQQIPFLKCNPKIHKLSTIDIMEKNVKALTFRPICDSKFYTTKPCSQALSSILCGLKEKIISMFPSMKYFYPLDSCEVARKLRLIKFPPHEPYSFIVSCDLSDAYSNCWLTDLLKAATFLSKLAGFDGHTIDMIHVLAKFILSNNYVESGGKIYKFNPVLPMGCCLSGEALDIILMAGEVMIFVKPVLKDNMLEALPKYISYPGQILKVIDYERYRDDTKILISGEKPLEIVMALTYFAKNMFPPQIPISFEYSTFIQSFLGCCFFVNFGGRSFSTFPRYNFTRPSKGIHVSSNTNPQHAKSGFTCNAINYSRICSEGPITELSIKLLGEEMALAGHSQHAIFVWGRRVKALIKLHNDRDTDMIDTAEMLRPSSANEKIVQCYPPAVIFDTHSNVASLANDFVEEMFSHIMDIKSVPKTGLPTLKETLITKSIYRKQIGLEKGR